MATASERIKHILEDDVFQDVVQEFKQNQLDGIQYSLPEHQEEREVLYRRINALNDFLGYLESIAMDSKIRDNNQQEL